MHPLSFIRGALFGAFIMYLFAPRSGEETRRMFAQQGDNLKKSLGDIAGTVTDELTAANQQNNTQDEAVLIAAGTFRPMTYEQQP